MPWKEVNAMDLRREFVLLAQEGQMSFARLCRRYSISRKTGYKWMRRYTQEGDCGLADRSRRPQHQPLKTPKGMERLVLQYRARYTDWGGRKLARLLRNDGHHGVPSPSTITEILRRNGQLQGDCSASQGPFIRFEHPHPNDLWQMDFKGDFALARGRCHPLTVLDDHSRFALCLKACANERQGTVKTHLTSTFTRYGLPLRMTMDNGSPWGGASERLTQLDAWLIELGIGVSHSRPYHPQTQGKDERFHRTLNTELIGRRTFANQRECQQAFDPWRHRYNTLRPHEAKGMDTPIEHYHPSPREYPGKPPPYEYASGDQVRTVGKNLTCSFKYCAVFVGQALLGKQVAFRPTTEDGIYTVHFCHHLLGRVDLKAMEKRTARG
ncbi:IS481 family transposase, partial [Elongatibacter sediminis]